MEVAGPGALGGICLAGRKKSNQGAAEIAWEHSKVDPRGRSRALDALVEQVRGTWEVAGRQDDGHRGGLFREIAAEVPRTEQCDGSGPRIVAGIQLIWIYAEKFGLRRFESQETFTGHSFRRMYGTACGGSLVKDDGRPPRGASPLVIGQAGDVHGVHAAGTRRLLCLRLHGRAVGRRVVRRRRAGPPHRRQPHQSQASNGRQRSDGVRPV